MLDMGFREDLEEILDATPPERRTLLFSATMPQADRRARQALPARRAAHLDGRRGARPWRHRLSGDDRRAGRDRACGGQSAAAARGRIGSAVLRDARQCPAAPFEPDRARLQRRRSVRRAQPERAQPGAAGAARRPRAGAGRDRRRRARHRPAEPLAGRPCRAAARRRDAAAPLRAAPAAPARRGSPSSSSPIRAASGSNRCCAARGSRRNGSSRRRPEDIARGDRERLLAALLAPAEIEEEDRALAQRAARSTRRPRRSPPLWSASTARGCRRPRSWPTPAPRRTAGRRGRARASRTRSGSGWTSAGATMPIRAGSCLCSAGAATSPRTRSARSGSPPARRCSKCRARSRASSRRR